MRREAAKFSLLLLCLLCVFFFKSLFLNNISYPLDILNSYSPWSESQPASVKPHNSLLTDQAFQFYPWLLFNHEILESGSFPLWNPYICCGSPHFANHQSAFLFPINFLYHLFPHNYIFVFIVILKLYLAGLFSFLFFRSINIDFYGSSFASIAFTFCGYMIVWINHPHTNVAIFLPIILFFTEKLIINGRFPSFLFLILAFCFQYFGGHLPTSFHILITTIIYFIFRTGISGSSRYCSQHSSNARRLFFASIILGTLLASIQLFPSLEYIIQSAEFHDRLLTKSTLFHFNFPRPDLIFLLFFPRAFGTPVNNDYWGEIFGPGFNFNETNGAFVGILTVLIAFCGFYFWKKNKHILFFGIIAVFSMAITSDFPIISNILNYAPAFNIVSNYRLSLFLAFSICALAGFALTYVPQSNNVLPFLAKFSRLIIIAGFGNLFILIFILTQNEMLIDVLNKLINFSFSHSTETTISTCRGPLFVPFSLPLMLNNAAIFISNLNIYFAVYCLSFLLSAFAIHLFLNKKYSVKSIKLLMFIVLVSDLFYFGMGYNPAVKPPPVLKNYDLTKNLPADDSMYRILFLDDILPPNLPMLFKIQDVDGYDALEIKRYYEFSLLSSLEKIHEIKLDHIPVTPDNLLNLLNVKYVISKQDVPNPSLQLIRDGKAKIYLNPHYLPRAYVVPSAEVMKSPPAIFQEIANPNFDPRKYVILEEEIPGLGDGFTTGTAEIKSYSPTKIVLHASSTSPAVLVLLDSYFPGWKAYLDGRETRIFPAYHAFRAVTLPPGKHQIVFLFNPLSFKLGKLVSLLGIAFVTLLGLYHLVKKTKSRVEP